VEERAAIRSAVKAWLAGQRPHPLYLFGPRGSGKSHLLSLAMGELRGDPSAELRVLHVPEDVPAASSANELLARIARSDRGARGPVQAGAPGSIGRAVVFIEALDVHLAEMSLDERRELRRRWQDDGFLIVATGHALTDAFTSRDEPFYHAFRAQPVLALTGREAAALLDRIVRPAVSRSATWPARREVLMVLAEGSPRALCALGAASGADPAGAASDVLLAVVQQLSAHHLHGFRALSAQQQRIVEALCLEPAEAAAARVGQALGLSSATVTSQCRRLQDQGVLLTRDHHGQTLWRVAEPLFRCWFEYRSAPWEEGRVALLARLLEGALRPPRLAELGRAETDALLREAAHRAGVAPDVEMELTSRFLSALAMRRGDVEALARLPVELQPMALLTAATRGALDAGARTRHAEVLQRSLPWLAGLIDSVEMEPTGDAKQDLFAQVRALNGVPLAFLPWASGLVVGRLDTWVERRGAAWVLTPSERRELAGVPFLRGMFLRRGERPRDAPLLAPEDVLRLKSPRVSADWTGLLVACLEDRQRRLAGALMARVPDALVFVPHPRPGTPGDPDVALLELLIERSGSLWTSALLSWGGVLGQMDDGPWATLLQGHARWVHHPAVDWEARVAGVRGLTLLYQERADRFEALRGALSGVAPWADVWFARAEEVGNALARSDPRWHVELQEVVTALFAEGA
jgi:biotin operon repressor